MSAPFLQSDAWGAFQSARGYTVIREHGESWSYLAVVETGTGNRRLYTPYGPQFRNISDFDDAITSLKQQAASQKATFIRIEPTQDITPEELLARGFIPVNYNQLQPQHTQIIDLSKTNDGLLAEMSQNSRNITRNYHKKGIVIHTSRTPSDINILTSLLRDVAKRTGIQPHSSSYFQTQANSLFPLDAATLYYATLDNEPIAAALVYDSETTRYYAHAAASDAHRKLNAGTAIVGQLILDAKEAGLSTVDLYGISPNDDPSHPWAGFTKFKQSFGGTPVSYVGAWDFPVKPLAYRFYRLYQRINKWRRGR